MVDIHSHIIWGIDDGSKTEEMTLEMLNQAIKSGTKHIVATPHFTRGYFEMPYLEVKKHYEELKAIVKKNNLNIEVHLGQEVYYKENLVEHYENQEIGTINEGKYMLVELPMREFEIDKILDELYELQIKGIKIIIAHPERYVPFIKHPSCINKFIEEGFLFQLNAGSLVGDFNSEVERLSHKYLNAGIYSFIGSDGHKSDKRNCDMIKAIEFLSKENKEALKAFDSNGIKLLNNEDIEFTGQKIERSRSNTKKKGIFQKLFGK